MATSMTFKSNSAQVIFDCLIKAGIKVEVISKRFKLMKITHQGTSFFIKGTSFSVNSQPSSLIANNKFLTKKVLASAGIPTPKSYLCHSASQARQLIQEKKLFPCVLKPAKGAHGTKVYANIETFKELDTILPYLFTGKGAKDILIEDFIQGNDYRVMVVGNKVSAIMERIPAHVIGDGIHTIRQLITKFNRNPLVGEKYEKPMCKIIRNGEVARNLLKKNLTFTSIPSLNQQVFLRQNANISTGGIGKDATRTAPAIVSTMAIKAAQAIGMNITGVDILYDPLAKKAFVLELNDQPGIDIHHYPVLGQPQNVAQDIIDYLLQANDLQINKNTPHINPLPELRLTTPTRSS
jgi:cyanophycin synthetase